MSIVTTISINFRLHLPTGSTDSQFRQCVENSLVPCLRLLESVPHLSCSLFLSGPILEWLSENRPAAINRINVLVRTERIEMLGGPLFQPVLPGIPAADRIGQIIACSERISDLFSCDPRGMLLPENVWQESLASEIAAADLEYVILDRAHFLAAGFSETELNGYFVTEDEGSALCLFPAHEMTETGLLLQPAEEILELLSNAAGNSLHTLVIDIETAFSNSGSESCSTTADWLTALDRLVADSSSLIRCSTPSQLLDSTPSLGQCYLATGTPDRSATDGSVCISRQSWRSERLYWKEGMDMYARMMGVSSQLARIRSSDVLLSSHKELIQRARLHLYRGQCNDAYWNGPRNGLFQPSLRAAVHRELIEAENLLLQIEQGVPAWIAGRISDENFDLRREVRLSNHRISALVAPAQGGQLTELNVRTPAINLLATLSNTTPQPKAQPAADAAAEESAAESSTNDLPRFWPRRMLVDHFLRPDLTLQEFQRHEGLISDFEDAFYHAVLHEGETRIALEMHTEGKVQNSNIKVSKTIVASMDRPGELLIQYRLSGPPDQQLLHFGAEFNFALQPDNPEDSYFYDSQGQPLGGLTETLILRQTDRVCMIDESLGLDISLELAREADFWISPVLTSNPQTPGEGRLQQSICIVPHWQFQMPASGSVTLEMRLLIDSSVAQARQLAGPAEQSLRTSASPFRTRTSVDNQA